MGDPTGSTSDLERLFLQVLRRSWLAIFSGALRRSLPGQCSPQQLFVLAHLSKRSMQPSELSRYQHVGMPAVTGLIDGLVTRGLVERRHDSSDRRAVVLSITPAGQKILELAEAQFADAAHLLLAPLSPEQRVRLALTLADLDSVVEPAPGTGTENDDVRHRSCDAAEIGKRGATHG